MSPTATIELDVSADWEPPEQPRPSRPVHRWIALGLVLVGVFALATGAQRPTSLSPAVEIQADGIKAMRANGHVIFLLRVANAGQTIVEARRMDDGARLWTSTVDSQADFTDVSDERVVLGLSEPGTTTASILVGLDATSGAQVWRRSGITSVFYGFSGAPGVIISEPFVSDAEMQLQMEQPLRGNRQMVAIDTRTGDTRWSLVTPAGTVRSYTVVGGPAVGILVKVNELDPDGALRVRNAETGEVVQRAKLVDSPGRVDAFDIIHGQLITYRNGDAGVQGGTVFDLTTGRRLWAAPDKTWLWQCGSVLCAGNGNDGAVTALDPGTGRQRWRLDERAYLEPIDDKHLLATQALEPDSGATGAGATGAGALIVDGTTGQVTHRLTGWDVVELQAWPNLLTVHRSKTGAAVLARLNLDTGVVTVFGRVNNWYGPPQCSITATLLICKLAHIVIWRLPA